MHARKMQNPSANWTFQFWSKTELKYSFNILKRFQNVIEGHQSTWGSARFDDLVCSVQILAALLTKFKRKNGLLTPTVEFLQTI